MRKPEPHELKAARALARQENNPYWDDLSLVHQDKYLLRVRRILRAAGRGGKVLKAEVWCPTQDDFRWPSERGCKNCRQTILLDLGPARRGRGGK